MRLPEPVRDNLRFLIAETSEQVGQLICLLESPSPAVAGKILERRGYPYNLKMRIHDRCIEAVRRTKSTETLETSSLRSAEAISSQLERLTDLIHDSVGQLDGQKRKRSLKALRVTGSLNDVLKGVQLIPEGIDEQGTKTANKIGQISRRISSKYESFYEDQSSGFKEAKRPEEVIAALFVANQINEMGAILLSISESLLSATVGRPLRTDRFRLLESAFEDLGLDSAEISTVAETNSGATISRIDGANEEWGAAIMKDGAKKKLKEERASVEAWHELFPGLAPQILSFRQRGDDASLLIEHLPGFTFEQVLLNGSQQTLDETLRQLTSTLQDVWKETREDRSVRANYLSQLRKRIPSVREIHGELAKGRGRICGYPTQSLDDLIERVEPIEREIEAPFSVYIHGDFNLDNIIYDPSDKRINFIDLHRSKHSDYVQDVTVFLVSNYRLQVLDRRTRTRIRDIAVEFYKFASRFARRNQDRSFDTRLALGLARSFITSTRFILDKSLAKAMYLRGIYILERIADSERDESRRRLPIGELFS